MWEPTRFEKRMQQALESELNQADAENFYSQYISARRILLKDIYGEIRGAEPNLTDHGADHIQNVLKNLEALLPPPEMEDHFTALELYLLGLTVLFHDVGNLEGRAEHNKRIARFYDYVRRDSPERIMNEKRLVIAAAKAHTGRSSDGDRDTLRDVPEDEYFEAERVRLRQLAALLRFADELAEGLQRTSLYLLQEQNYPRDSELHHRYSSVTHVAIDRQRGRIALNYHVDFDVLSDTLEGRLEALEKLLQYVCVRITKLDEERRYARFYCTQVLDPFQKTSARIEIHSEGEFLDLGLGSIELSDKVIPNGRSGAHDQISRAFDPARIKDIVKSKVSRRRDNVRGQVDAAGGQAAAQDDETMNLSGTGEFS